MKHLLPLVLLAASVSFTGCSSLSNLFGSGNEERAYNAETGEYEWPEDSNGPRAGTASAPQRRGDGRYFDTAKNEWVQAPEEGSGSERRPGSAPAAEISPALQPIAAPPPPPPSRASGIYNASTGQIEWNTDPSAPRPAPAPARRKNWWWPF